MARPFQLTDFLIRTTDKVRYADTDRQGHVNNAVFATFMETGRVEILYAPDAPLAPPGTEWVIAHLSLDFLSELRWPGTVTIGTRVLSMGRSSVKLEQGVFQEGVCAATAQTTLVLIDSQARRSTPLPPHAVQRLSGLLVQEQATEA